MTTFMAQQAAEVISVELDRNMYKLASVATSSYDNVTLMNCDALKNKNRFNPDVIDAVTAALEAEPGRQLKLVANLPYSIATPVVSNLVATGIPWAGMVVTIQFELGLRMRARPRSSHYGSLSVWLQSQCDVSMIKKLGPTVFWPRPKVNSAIMQILPDAEKRALISDRAFFQDYVRRLFHHRRKYLRSVLVGMYRKQVSKSDIDALLEQLGLVTTVRAEELDVATHVQLANALCEAVRQAA